MGATSSCPSHRDALRTSRQCLVDALPADVLAHVAESSSARTCCVSRAATATCTACSATTAYGSDAWPWANTVATPDSGISSRDLSFDVSFALVRSTDASRRTGGVLLGAQATTRSSAAGHSESFVLVDGQRHLHCSILRDKPVVTASLRVHRWYHLALTYDYGRQRQRVYLDGHHVHSAEGSPSWPWLQFAQLGAASRQAATVPGARSEGSSTSSASATARGRRRRCSDWLEASCTRHVEIVSCQPPWGRDHLVARSCLPTRAKAKSRSCWPLIRQCL